MPAEARRAVLGWLAGYQRSTVEQIGRMVRERLGSMSTQ